MPPFGNGSRLGMGNKQIKGNTAQWIKHYHRLSMPRHGMGAWVGITATN